MRHLDADDVGKAAKFYGLATPSLNLTLPAGVCASVEVAFVDGSGNRGSIQTASSGSTSLQASNNSIFFGQWNCGGLDLGPGGSDSLISNTVYGFLGGASSIPVYVMPPAAGATVTTNLMLFNSGYAVTSPASGFTSYNGSGTLGAGYYSSITVNITGK